MANQLKARRRDSGDEADDDEVARLEQEFAGAIFPNVFESELELAVGAEFQAVLSETGARNILTETL